MEEAEKAGLHWVDYLVFAAMLTVSMAIGVYHSLSGGCKKTTSEYLMASRQMTIIPTTLSLMVSFMSSVLLLGVPAELYCYGIAFWMMPIGTSLAAILSVILFIPVLYPLKITSVNQYLELRYKSKLIKYIGCLCAVILAVFYTANVFFGPSTAIEAVSGFPTWASILLASMVSITYTTLGGIRGIIWTDVFQTLIMLAGASAVLIMGSIKVGGLSEVFQIASDWGRLNVSFDPNPTLRLTFWSVTFGHVMLFLGFYGYNQSAMQRFSAMDSLKKAKMCVLGVVPGNFIMHSLACVLGLVAFAYYTKIGCDPLAAGQISNPNQILPYLVVDIFCYPGIPGLFIASLSAAALSTASSNINSAAANAWGDIFKDILPKLREDRATLFTKAIVLIFGIMSTIMAFGLTKLGGTVTQMMLTFNSCLGGPLAALFLMGILIPWVNWKGAALGSLISFAVGLWISFGSYSIKRHLGGMPTTTENCSVHSFVMNYTTNIFSNFTITTDNIFFNYTATGEQHSEYQPWYHSLYSMSYLLMQPFNTLLAILLSVAISFLTGFEKPEDVDPKLIHPGIRRLLRLQDKSTLNFEKYHMVSLETESFTNGNVQK